MPNKLLEATCNDARASAVSLGASGCTTMYFRDLTPYQNCQGQQKYVYLNVGWLCVAHPFATGECPIGFLRRLQRLAASPVNLSRGIHLCDLCPDPPESVTANGLRKVDPLPGSAGNGEIYVPGRDNVVYVAPALVAHYVQAHYYLPPAEFIHALMAFDDSSST
jgi:hypothetical protein